MVIGGWRGPAWRIIDRDPRNARHVRDWISSAIALHRCPADPEDAALIVDELFVNAVEHGPRAGRVLVGYCMWNRGMRMVVCDGGGTTVPRLIDATKTAEGGRGLCLVNTLAARWGSFRLPGAQVVWSDLGQPLRAPAADTWAWLPPVLATSPLTAAAPAAVPGPAAMPGILAAAVSR